MIWTPKPVSLSSVMLSKSSLLRGTLMQGKFLVIVSRIKKVDDLGVLSELG